MLIFFFNPRQLKTVTIFFKETTVIKNILLVKINTAFESLWLKSLKTILIILNWTFIWATNHKSQLLKKVLLTLNGTFFHVSKQSYKSAINMVFMERNEWSYELWTEVEQVYLVSASTIVLDWESKESMAKDKSKIKIQQERNVMTYRQHSKQDSDVWFVRV